MPGGTAPRRPAGAGRRAMLTQPWELLGQAETPDGRLMALTRRGQDYLILADGKDLMTSRLRGSEMALARIGCQQAANRPRPCVLVGGLGMGFTLRAALDALPAEATVVVAELMPAVVSWNRGPLGHLADHPLKDGRVQVEVRDVARTLQDGVGRFDAVLLDVDNGPAAFTLAANADLYTDEGLARVRAALRPEGVLAVWSARPSRRFEHRLRYHGFCVEARQVRARLDRGGPMHTLFVGRL